MRLTAQRRALIIEALSIAEQSEQTDAADALRLVDRLGFHSIRKEAELRVKQANLKARAFDKLRRELEVE